MQHIVLHVSRDVSRDVCVWVRLYGYFFPPLRRSLTLIAVDVRVDTAGHAFGPASDAVNGAISVVDAALGSLLSGLSVRRACAAFVLYVHVVCECVCVCFRCLCLCLRLCVCVGVCVCVFLLTPVTQAAGWADTTDIIVVSDHGMAETPSQQVVYLADFIDIAQVCIGCNAGRAPHSCEGGLGADNDRRNIPRAQRDAGRNDECGCYRAGSRCNAARDGMAESAYTSERCTCV